MHYLTVNVDFLTVLVFLISHNHRPCRWLAIAPLGHVTGWAYRLVEKSANRTTFTGMPLKGLYFICPLLPADPWTGRHTLWCSTVLLHNLVAVDFVCTVLLLFYCALLYQHKILYTRNVYFHICISYWRISQISSNCSFLWDTPLFVIHYTWAVLRQAYEYGLCTLLLRVSLLPCIRIVFSA